ncbi:hypothetical protein [Macrococcoides caseolyticum]|uniref:Uncharacterized protein n=1 Tax=Macrococcoides caseolyticum TaxID=69966 RepID=A0ACC9MNY9_9STAP|nr:hypothetical protein [Macrococcus caseolyticus]PKE40480.1 hypothetical protein CW675_01855 [Macrococcus caseolyticus]PKE55316.1 hypothetical protein CW682_12290 [Macrococcus caseolyticus]
MKIKQTRQVRLDELIKHCIENDKFGNEGTFWSITEKVKVMVYKDDVVIEDAYTDFNITKTFFTITEEVEIDYDTRLDLIAVRKVGTVSRFENRSIQGVLSHFNKRFEVEVDYIYFQNEDGSIGELIWDKERELVD